MTKKYSLTEEHKARFAEWRDKWIANAMSTEPMGPADIETLQAAVRGLYEAADLEPPPPHRIIVVPSPFVLRFASGFASWVWHQRENGTDVPSNGPVPSMTDTEGEDIEEWYQCGLKGLHRLAEHFGGAPALECAQKARRLWNGGNQWSGWVSYLSFFRHVVKLDESHGVDYTKWQHYETLARYGPRVVHEKFCMISDRPELLTVDEQNRPHNATGPFCRWRDGSALYAWHGVHVPARWILAPQTVDSTLALTWENIEQRRALCEILGWEKVLSQLDPVVKDRDPDPEIGELIHVNLPDTEGASAFLRVRCGTGRDFVLSVPVECHTAREANAWTYGIEADSLPKLRT